jgi:hypothetical protein
VCLNKIIEPPASGGLGPYKDCRATDDDYDNGDQWKMNIIPYVP